MSYICLKNSFYLSILVKIGLGGKGTKNNHSIIMTKNNTQIMLQMTIHFFLKPNMLIPNISGP